MWEYRINTALIIVVSFVAKVFTLNTTFTFGKFLTDILMFFNNCNSTCIFDRESVVLFTYVS